MLKIILIAVLLVPALVLAEESSYKPENGFVPDKETAIAIAVAIWTPIYGAALIQREKPFVATLRNGVWHVTGSLPIAQPGYIVVGGVAEADIAQSDGRIIRVIHGK